MPSDTDRLLRRLERTAVVWWIGVAALALLWRRGRPDVAVGVLGGGVLAGASYWAIKSGIDRLSAHLMRRAAAGATTARGEAGASRQPARAPWRAVALMGLRYALLALLAYVMIARLRLHPIGLLLGASSVVAAAAIEALRIPRS